MRIASHHNMPKTFNESQLNLALQALHQDQSLSLRQAAKIYNDSRNTLSQRKQGIQSRRDIIPNSQKLTDLEEKTIIQRVLELDS